MSLKIYKLKNIMSFSTNVIVDNRTVRVVFNGGKWQAKTLSGGEFATTNDKIQKALESRSDYGNLFYLKEEIENKSEEKKAAKKEVENKIEKENVGPKDGEGDVEYKEYDSPTTIQAAAKIMVEEYGCSFGSVNTKEKLLAKAEEKKVKFTNIK